MFTSLDIQNFQAHDSTKLDFHPGMNVIVGSSDSGKTAILRALELVRTNQPDGMRHISHWARERTKAGKIRLTDRMSVKLTTDKGTIERFRDEKENGYSVNGNSLLAIGEGIPDSVSNFLNLSDVNVSKQHDPHFFLSWSPPVISRYLNGICGMGILDQCVAVAIEFRNETKKEIAKATLDVEEHTNTISELAWVDEAKVILGKAAICQSQKDAFDGLVSGLTASIFQANQALEIVQRSEKYVHADKLLMLAKESNARATKSWQGVGSLLRLINDLEALELTKKKTVWALDAIKLIEAAKIAGKNKANTLEKLQNLNAIITANWQAQTTICKYAEYRKADAYLSKVSALYNLAKVKQETALSLHGLIQSASQAKAALGKTQWPMALETIGKARRSYKKASAANADTQSLSLLITQCLSQAAIMRRTTQDIEVGKITLDKLRAQLQKCPTCGQIWHGNH